jgi:hypothetical protein
VIDWLARGIGALALVFGATLIEIPSWGSANLIEIIWTATGVGMIAVSVWALPRVIGDWIIGRRIPGHYSKARTLLARGHIRREIIRLAQGGIVLTIGIYAVVQPNPLPGPVVVSPFALVLTVGLLALGALTGLQSVLDSRQRTMAEHVLSSGGDE